ncbi:MAG TPA: hypothetical protein VN824_22605, partial [Puia sp.]|nr:hypothetical protein [Puia sp.]
GPAAVVKVPALFDWSGSSDSAIRYYSGSAVYTNSFELNGVGGKVYIDLGRVENIATVYVNGVDCGTVWTVQALDITRAVHAGRNELKVVVTNTWANRLTGDQRLPVDLRRTWTTSPWKSDGALLPAGLLGPVYIRY